MSFPQLLRRSSFAAHDPLITRVYTSTPSSIAQSGDWGLKYPIYREKGPRYIRVSNLDAGRAIGADWRSGEKEARFMETWGTGRVAWTREGDGTADVGASYSKRRSSIFDTDPDAATSAGAGAQGTEQAGTTGTTGTGSARRTRLMPDVEAMTPKEFERHLETVRADRTQALNTKIRSLGEKVTAGWRTDEGDATMINLAVGRHATDVDAAQMQAGLVHTRLTAPGSTSLHGRSHALGGLSYSVPPTSSNAQSLGPMGLRNASYIDPRTTYPGRVLNKKARDQHRADSVGRPARAMPSDTNTPFVVAIGGLTAASQPYSAGMAGISGGSGAGGFGSDDSTIVQTDYTRTYPDRGIGRFQIKDARFASLPTVLGLEDSTIKDKYAAGFTESKAKKAAPLDTFAFDIDLELASVASASDPGKGKKGIEPGSREWVGREQRRRLSKEDQLGLGQRRQDRTRGQALSNLRSAERAINAEHRQRFEGVMAKLTRVPPRQTRDQ